MWEALVIALVGILAVSLLVSAVGLGGGSLRRAAGVAPLAGGAVALALVGVAVASRTPPPLPQPEDAPREVLEGDYRASTACRACHPEQYASWHRSYHRTMTQAATPEAVTGDFDDRTLYFGGRRFRLFERDGTFYGEMKAPDWAGAGDRRVTVPLRQTTGSHHMQLYWYPAGRGRALAIFPLAYLVDEQRWLPRRSAFIGPPGPPPPTFALWNRVCVECHATRSRPRIGGGRIDTEVVELGIACEACHGPGGPHLAANRSPLQRYAHHFGDDGDSTIVNPAELSHERSAQVCGQCHATKTLYDAAQLREWEEHGSGFRPGDDLEASVNLISKERIATQPALRQLLDRKPEIFRSMFWSDGVVRVSGREYSAVRQSACFTRGEMSCLSCHRLHQSRDDPRSASEWADDQLAPGMDGDLACTGCHPTFAQAGAQAEHTRHDPGSIGSRCQACHMPYTTYGLLKAIRDHQVASPNIASELETGRPNACNQCHLDESLGWTKAELARGWGIASPELTRDEEQVAAGVRWALQGDAGVRALTAWAMGFPEAQATAGTGWMPPYLLELLDDPYDAVRVIARRSLRTLPGFESLDFDELAPEKRRAVRVAELRREWSQRSPSPREGRTPATGFDAQGRLETSTFERLLEGRDRRPLELLE